MSESHCDVYDVVHWSDGLDGLDGIDLTIHDPMVVQITFDDAIDQFTDRSMLRKKVHEVVLVVLSAHFQCAIDCIHIKRTAGTALRCEVHTSDKQVVIPWISISYADNIAVIAISLNQALGLDVLKADPDFLSQSWQEVAQLYLAPTITQEIVRLTPITGALRFAQEWVKLEAHFKCAELALTEYSAELHKYLPVCTYFWLILPKPYFGVMALKH
jgi:hypothetical protein